MLVGTYSESTQPDDEEESIITLEEKDGQLYGNDGNYRYRLIPVEENVFVNPDDGEKLVFNVNETDSIYFNLFGDKKFEKLN